jgi:hypothetical protein
MILCLMTNHVKENAYPSMEETTQEEFEYIKWVIIIRIDGFIHSLSQNHVRCH